jgi:hypothetical protein
VHNEDDSESMRAKDGNDNLTGDNGDDLLGSFRDGLGSPVGHEDPVGRHVLAEPARRWWS